MTWRFRTDRELREIYDEFPELESLKNSIERIDNIEVLPNGTGQCVFKIYLAGHTRKNDELIRLFKSFDESDISWSHLPENNRDYWKGLWRQHVRNPNNDWGSRVKKHTSAETIIRIVDEFARYCFPCISLAEEVTVSGGLIEGAVCQVIVNAYERNPIARTRCIAHYGPSCVVCGFDFGAVYGPLAEGFIHIHHLKPLSQIGAEYEVDPVADLRPVCPNCHAVIHLGGECRDIEEVSQLLRRTSVSVPKGTTA